MQTPRDISRYDGNKLIDSPSNVMESLLITKIHKIHYKTKIVVVCYIFLHFIVFENNSMYHKDKKSALDNESATVSLNQYCTREILPNEMNYSMNLTAQF